MNKEDLGVVGAMLEDPMAWHYGLGLSESVGIAAGTIYPTLARLERSGWLESRWERTAGEARRRLYRLTGVGQRCGAVTLAEHPAELPARRAGRRFRFGIPRPKGALG